jgi:hypothetical protein
MSFMVDLDHQWIELIDSVGQRLVTLAMRSDNIYVTGFANRRGEWFAFNGEENTIPGSMTLSYMGSYADNFRRIRVTPALAPSRSIGSRHSPTPYNLFGVNSPQNLDFCLLS